MTFEDFAIAGKERGYSRDEVIAKAAEYERDIGAFETVGNNNLAQSSMNDDVLPSDPERRQFIESATTKRDVERVKAKRFYDLKFGVDHDPASLQARIQSEYGEEASFEMANQYNSEPLKYKPTVVVALRQLPQTVFDKRIAPETGKGLVRGLYNIKALPGDIISIGADTLENLRRNIRRNFYDPRSATGRAQVAIRKLRGIEAPTPKSEIVATPRSKVAELAEEGRAYAEYTRYLKETGAFAADPEVFEKTFMENPSIARLLGGTAESVPPMALGLGAKTKLGRNIATAIMTATESLPEYQQMKDSGMSQNDALSNALAQAVGTFYLERVGLEGVALNNPIMRKISKKFGARWLVGTAIAFASEGSTEGLQTIYQNALAAGYDDDREAFDGLMESILGGGLLGGGMSITQSMAQNINDSFRKEVVDEAVVSATDDSVVYTFGDANTIRNTMSDIEIEQEVSAAPEHLQELAREAFLNPTPEKVSALNQALTEDDAVAEEVPVADAIENVEIVDEADIIGFSTEKINEARQERGEDVLTEEEVKGHQQSMNEAMEQGLDKTSDALAERVLESADNKDIKTYQMSDSEVAGMGARIVELRNERIQILQNQKVAMESGDQDAVDQTYIELTQNAAKSDQIEAALKTSATASGRANSMMASMVNRFTYDVVSLEAAARAAKGENLTTEETADIQNVAEQIASLEGKIADVKEQLRTGEFKETEKRIRKDEPKEITRLRTELALLQRDARNKIYDLRTKTARDWIKEIATLPRSLMATADMSYGLRQGLLPSFAHPKIAAKTWWKAFKSFFSQKTAAQVDLEMRDHPLHTEIAALGTHFSSLDSAIEDRTEFFASNLAEKIPAFGKVVMASERNMVTGINLLRQGLMVDLLTKHPDASTEAKKAYARYVNIATGRGEARLLDRAAEELSLAFFAPRFAVSRVQAPAEAARLLKHPELRAEIIKQWAAYLGTGMSVLALAKMAGADVEDDPDSSDWGKIVIDNKHIDIWGGIQQPMRILAKAIKGGVERVKGDETDVNTIADIGNFLKYKLSPPVAIFNELLSGEDVIGRETEEIEVGDIELPKAATVFVKNMTPLVIQSAVEAYQEGEDPAVVSALALGEGLGLSIGVYDKKTK